MGKSLTFRGTVYEASEMIKTHRCKDPICDTHLWKVKHELDMARWLLGPFQIIGDTCLSYLAPVFFQIISSKIKNKTAWV